MNCSGRGTKPTSNHPLLFACTHDYLWVDCQTRPTHSGFMSAAKTSIQILLTWEAFALSSSCLAEWNKYLSESVLPFVQNLCSIARAKSGGSMSCCADSCWLQEFIAIQQFAVWRWTMFGEFMMGVDLSLYTVLWKCRHEISLMNPNIGPILATFFNRQGLMTGSSVHDHGIGILDRRPNEDPSSLGRYL